MQKRYILIFIVAIFLIAIFGIDSLKKHDIEQFKEKNIEKIVEQSDIYLKALIKEKQNTTSTIAVGLVNSQNVKDALKNSSNHNLNLRKYSLELKEKTDFKNVWFQLINKDGISVQRSWTNFKGDNISQARIDLQKILKNPKVSNTISVGKFDMTFKSIFPIYDNGDLLGLIEVITHFNSIAKKMEENNIKSIFLVDKRYKKQLTKPFTNIFVEDYYVANFNADKHILKELNENGIENYLDYFRTNKYIIDKDINSVISYHTLKNIKDETMSHTLLINDLSLIDINKIDEMIYLYNIYFLLVTMIFGLIFYFFYISKLKVKSESSKLKLLIYLAIGYIFISLLVFKFFYERFKSDQELLKNNIKNQTVLEYNSITKNNEKISNMIFESKINKPKIIELFKNNKRDELYKYLEKEYINLKHRYNIRQLHFHTKENLSFLRMHRPSKFGDDLTGFRASVDYVNKRELPYHGFEEGRIFNGFRNVFPIFDEKKRHIGSVEVSFDIYSFIDDYINIFNSKRVNFLLDSKIVDKKVFKSEQSNYIKSPVDGYYFDKEIIRELHNSHKDIIPQLKSNSNFSKVKNIIEMGLPGVVHFEEVDEIAVVIPIVNNLTNKIVASVNISKSDKLLVKLKQNFYRLIVMILIVMLFIMIFIYRELSNKLEAQKELKKTQNILDSQSSFIVLTDGKYIQASNSSMLKFFGFDSLDHFKKDHNCICDFFINDTDRYLKKEMDGLTWFEYVKNHPSEDLQVQMKDKDGKIHIFIVQMSDYMKDESIITFIDITKLKKIESQLIESEKMASLGTMIGNIAHQWRQPLSVISTSASGVQIKNELGLLDSQELDALMDSIVKNTQFLSDTIDTFRDFIKEKKTIKEIDIQENLNTILKILEPTLKNNHITLVNKIDYETSMTIKMALGELSQVISNLVNNAKDILVEKNIQNPTITIECSKIEDTIEISIEDNAGGVPDDVISHIFEPYFTTKHQSQGTGLGLYMSHKIVTESLGGKLYVNNTQNGAKFTIELKGNNN